MNFRWKHYSLCWISNRIVESGNWITLSSLAKYRDEQTKPWNWVGTVKKQFVVYGIGHRVICSSWWVRSVISINLHRQTHDSSWQHCCSMSSMLSRSELEIQRARNNVDLCGAWDFNGFNGNLSRTFLFRNSMLSATKVVYFPFNVEWNLLSRSYLCQPNWVVFAVLCSARLSSEQRYFRCRITRSLPTTSNIQ